MATVAESRVGKELQRQGVSLDVRPVDGGTLLAATYQGLTRVLQVNPEQEVRVITHPQSLFKAAGANIPDAPVLVVVGLRPEHVFVAPLQFEPKAVSTSLFLWGPDADQSNPRIQQAEELARQRGQLNGAYRSVEFTEGEVAALGISATEAHALVREGANGLLWTAARNTTIARKNTGTFLANEHAFADDLPESQRTTIATAIASQLRGAGDVVVSRQVEPELVATFDLAAFRQAALASRNADVERFLTEQFEAERPDVARGNLKQVRKTAPEGLLDATNGTSENDILTDYATTQKILELRERVLLEAGTATLNGLPFDIYAQRYLTTTREEVAQWGTEELQAYLAQNLGTRGRQQYERVMKANVAVQREEAAWMQAILTARRELMQVAERSITYQQLTNLAKIAVPRRRDQLAAERSVQLVDRSGYRTPVETLFTHREVSALSAADYARLPLRPVVIPTTNTENMRPHQLAEVIFDEILYSRLVADRESATQVGLAPKVRAEYISQVEYAIEHGLPIEASQYAPLIAIGNSLKRVTQAPNLADIDMVRRLAEISLAVELVYKPGLRFTLVNEIPAFQAPEMLNLDPAYVERFHQQTARLVNMVDPSGKRIRLMKLTDFLTGDATKRADWERFRQAKMAEVDAALEDSRDPLHDTTTTEINTFAYPMATCTDPYQFEAAHRLSTEGVTRVYEAIKHYTNSGVGGVGLSAETSSVTYKTLSPDEQALFHPLLERGREMAKIYRVTMSSRSELPAFGEVIPPHTVAYTMVTKRNKLVLHPNSGRGAYFPAHGEAVLVPASATNANEHSWVTVRPWKDVAANANYVPYFDPENPSQVLYWVARAT